MSTAAVGYPYPLSPDSWVHLRWRGPGQPKLFGSSEQVLDGRRVPPRSTTRRTFAHGLKLGSDLLQSAVRRGGGDAGDQPDQSIIARLARRPVQQFRLDDALGDQSPYRPAQPLHWESSALSRDH